MVTIDPAPRPVAPPSPGFAWRFLSPIGAVLLAFAILIIAAGALFATDLSDDTVATIAQFFTSALLLLFAVLLWRRLPEHNRRWAVAVRAPVRASVLIGVGIGLSIVVGATIILATGSAIDPVVERRLNDAADDLVSRPWQIALTVVALVVLAPLGEELLFRGLMLRALVRKIRFGWAAVVTSLLFTASHADSYLIWPRTVSLFGTGLVLAWIYRRRGYWASVAAHATVNTVAAIALIATS